MLRPFTPAHCGPDAFPSSPPPRFPRPLTLSSAHPTGFCPGRRHVQVERLRKTASATTTPVASISPRSLTKNYVPPRICSTNAPAKSSTTLPRRTLPSAPYIKPPFELMLECIPANNPSMFGSAYARRPNTSDSNEEYTQIRQLSSFSGPSFFDITT